MDSEELKTIFSKNLNYWLECRGKTQADLYKKTGVSSATASDWCNAKKIPRTDKIVEIARWLMIEIGDLLYEKEKSPNELDKIVFRLKDDHKFRELIADINGFNVDQYQKIEDYVSLLKK